MVLRGPRATPMGCDQAQAHALADRRPFLHARPAVEGRRGRLVPGLGERITLTGQVFDGNGAPIHARYSRPGRRTRPANSRSATTAPGPTATAACRPTPTDAMRSRQSCQDPSRARPTRRTRRRSAWRSSRAGRGAPAPPAVSSRAFVPPMPLTVPVFETTIWMTTPQGSLFGGIRSTTFRPPTTLSPRSSCSMSACSREVAPRYESRVVKSTRDGRQRSFYASRRQSVNRNSWLSFTASGTRDRRSETGTRGSRPRRLSHPVDQLRRRQCLSTMRMVRT
jgi:hypothetical protein